MSILLRRRELIAQCPLVIYDAQRGIGRDNFQVAGKLLSGSSKYTFSTSDNLSLLLEVFDASGTTPNGAVSIRTKNPIDFTDCAKLHFLVNRVALSTTASAKNGVRFQAGIGVCKEANKNSYALYRDIYLQSGSKTYQRDYSCTAYISAGTTVTMDVSAIESGHPSIGIYAYRSVTGGYWVRHRIEISKIWLERKEE